MSPNQTKLEVLETALKEASQIRGQELKLPPIVMADHRLIGGQSVTGPIPCLWPKVQPAYLVQVTLLDTGRRFDCVGLDVTPLRRTRPLNATLIHQLPVRELVKEAISLVVERRIAVASTFENMGLSRGPKDADFWDRYLEAQRKRLAEATRGEGPGRRYPPGHLAEVARIYSDATRAGKPTAAAVSEVFGISSSAAANQISRARAQGLLDTGKED